MIGCLNECSGVIGWLVYGCDLIGLWIIGALMGLVDAITNLLVLIGWW